MIDFNRNLMGIEIDIPFPQTYEEMSYMKN